MIHETDANIDLMQTQLTKKEYVFPPRDIGVYLIRTISVANLIADRISSASNDIVSDNITVKQLGSKSFVL